ncbi:MAG: ATP-binding protein [Mycobacteriales bacterium]
MGTDDCAVEAKRARSGVPVGLWESVSAFANASGGVILLGVDEKSGFAATGVEAPAATEATVAGICAEMEPPVRASITTVFVREAAVVVVEIPPIPRDQRPCHRKAEGPHSGSRLRVADGNRKLTNYEVSLLLANRREPQDDRRPVPGASVADLDGDIVRGLLRRLRDRQPRLFAGVADDEALFRVNALAESDGHLVPTVAGLLALGTYPQQFMPQMNVTVVVYPNREPGLPGPGGERFLDNQAIDGPIPIAVEEALRVLKRNMRRRSVVTGLYRRDEWEYPEEALREVLVNALAHRDLSPSAQGTQVQVEMFPDRLIVRNPGGLYGPIGIESLGVQGTTSARNKALLRLLEDTPLENDRTVCENRGSGIFVMRTAFRTAGMEPPQFRDNIATFEVIFPNHTLLDQATLDWLAEATDVPLSSGQVMALALMRRGEVLTNARYRASTGVADSLQARRELRELVETGLVTQEGRRGTTVYRLADLAVSQQELPIGPADVRLATGEDEEGRILAALAIGPLSRREVTARTGLSPGAALYRLRVLRAKGLVALEGEPRSKNARWRHTRRT